MTSEKQQGHHHRVDVSEPIMIVKYDESSLLGIYNNDSKVVGQILESHDSTFN